MKKTTLSISVLILSFITYSKPMVIDNLDDIRTQWMPFSDQVMGVYLKLRLMSLKKMEFLFID